ncbi:lysozyme C, milk isozyme-like [Hemitrygon akajei]|uniref:lysozyme C, milk isozyme-like n=1 Tax=Hemitrygon akajei TaxID=2704970 RepID=UPI003BF9CCCF
MRVLILLGALITGAAPYIFEKCELARLLRKSGLEGYRGYSLANWVCLVEHESSYNTRVVGHNQRDGKTTSSDYGLFQISSQGWCNDGRTQSRGRSRNSKNKCGKMCLNFINDNIADDIECVKKVVLPQGMNVWYGWKKKCQRRNLTNFLKDCKL